MAVDEMGRSQTEMALLGSILLLPNVLDEVLPIVWSSDFQDFTNRKIYEHMLALHKSNVMVDVTLLIDRLKKANDYDWIGGRAYLSKIVNSVPNAAHATYYAEHIRENSPYRNLRRR